MGPRTGQNQVVMGTNEGRKDGAGTLGALWEVQCINLTRRPPSRSKGSWDDCRPRIAGPGEGSVGRSDEKKKRRGKSVFLRVRWRYLRNGTEFSQRLRRKLEEASGSEINLKVDLRALPNLVGCKASSEISFSYYVNKGRGNCLPNNPQVRIRERKTVNFKRRCAEIWLGWWDPSIELLSQGPNYIHDFRKFRPVPLRNINAFLLRTKTLSVHPKDRDRRKSDHNNRHTLPKQERSDCMFTTRAGAVRKSTRIPSALMRVEFTGRSTPAGMKTRETRRAACLRRSPRIITHRLVGGRDSLACTFAGAPYHFGLAPQRRKTCGSATLAPRKNARSNGVNKCSGAP